jgi:hypothetical protein
MTNFVKTKIYELMVTELRQMQFGKVKDRGHTSTYKFYLNIF